MPCSTMQMKICQYIDFKKLLKLVGVEVCRLFLQIGNVCLSFT